MPPSDPFDGVKAVVAATVAEVEGSLRQWRSRKDEPNREMAGARLLVEIESVEDTLAEMDAAIEAAALNPERFQISDSEMTSRRAFVRSTRSTVAAAREELSRGRGATAKRSAAEERVGLLAGSGSGGSSGGGAGRRQREMDQDNTKLLGSHVSLQQAELAPSPSPALHSCETKTCTPG